MTLDEIERRTIVATLERFGGHRAKAAEALGIGIRTLSGKLRSYGYAPREKDFANVNESTTIGNFR
jgi:DNA-binding NtrC family response regulator